MTLDATPVLELLVETSPELFVGPVPEGILRIIPIVGGSFWGRDLRGRVLPGGADWNVEAPHGYRKVFAKYALQTDEGEFIAVENSGCWGPEGEGGTMKTAPQFRANSSGPHAWLNSGVFGATLAPRSDTVPGVRIQVYRLL